MFEYRVGQPAHAACRLLSLAFQMQQRIGPRLGRGTATKVRQPREGLLTRQRRDAAAATILDTESATSCTPLLDCYLLHSRCSRGSDRDLGTGTAAKVHQPREGLLTRQRRDAAAATILDTESANRARRCRLLSLAFPDAENPILTWEGDGY